MQSNWQTNFFRGAALDAWRRFVNPENIRADADFLERALHLNPGARLLDVPCGNGRHAIELAGRGYRMTGLDQSAEDFQPVFLGKSGQSGDGVCRFHISTNIEIMTDVKQSSLLRVP